MGVGAVLIASAVISAVGKGVSGHQKNKAAKGEARDVREEAGFLANQTREDAENVKERQKLKFIKSGLDIAPGTVLRVLKDTKKKGARQSVRIQERGRKMSRNLRRSGRNALVGGVFQGGSTAISAFGTSKLSGGAE